MLALRQNIPTLLWPYLSCCAFFSRGEGEIRWLQYIDYRAEISSEGDRSLKVESAEIFLPRPAPSAIRNALKNGIGPSPVTTTGDHPPPSPPRCRMAGCPVLVRGSVLTYLSSSLCLPLASHISPRGRCPPVNVVDNPFARRQRSIMSASLSLSSSSSSSLCYLSKGFTRASPDVVTSRDMF